MRKQQGFTLVEMLVVMGIIAILIGALVAGFSRMTKTAQKAKAQETVSNAATALAAILTTEGRWPQAILNASKQNPPRMNEAVAKALANRKLMSVACEYNEDGKVSKLVGVDKHGILDPWGAAVLKRNPGGGAGIVSDHFLYFAVDDDGDGIVKAPKVLGDNLKIRATAIVWCAGADGKLGTYGTRSKDGSDDVYSWSREQEVKP